MTTKTFNQFFFIICITLTCYSCKQKSDPSKNIGIDTQSSISYAEGFTIKDYGSHKIITVTEAWPGSDKTFNYLLVQRGQKAPDSIQADITLEIPITNVVVTSTTHIPSLEMLEVEHTLVGFPNLNYISSKKTRALIKQNKIQELGQNESLNTETTIALNPDVIISFGVDGQNKTLNSLERAGLPVAYNGDWVEKNPLGKAEWIKFFAAFYNKEKRADSIFKTIADRYNHTKELAKKASNVPTVLSGALYKDVWYLPNGESWAAKLIADANARYLYDETSGAGSLSLSLEEVLDQGQDADFWIAPNAFASYKELDEANPVYSNFKAYQTNSIYGFASEKGETGGLIYYELAPNRPDWVLEDLVNIFHPNLLPEHNSHFYKPLEHE